ncbi:hypothetical protein ACQW02_19130 [Humitalea sp. 24SJ18S-53]|uniref:hypothetical protein n=1 Tax=Humitalea sp. 24SJ18S-53 TaxID=3422307 RepID=UPI003D6718ED
MFGASDSISIGPMLPRRRVLGFGVAVCATGCATRTPPPLPPADDAGVDRLRAALAEAVPQPPLPDPITQDRIARAMREVAGSGYGIDRPELIFVVDRHPDVQAASILLARPDAPWAVIGGDRVSTGQADRRGYYITPTGVFLHTPAIRDYRALGTFNRDGIRGLGAQGMRVWDFGWIPARKGWRDDGETGPIRFLIHATDPDRLEPLLGRTGSQGCIRISAAMNLFLDRHGVLDIDHERALAEGDARMAALLRPDRDPTPLAGRALVVIDSSDPA